MFNKKKIEKALQSVMTFSLKKALKEQGLQFLFQKLQKIIPDIKNQYTSFLVDTPYLETKVRAQHAFQISMVDKAITIFNLSLSNYNLVDIGDSSGNHIKYISALFPEKFRTISVNLDKQAIEKIKKEGLEAIHGRAENIERYGVKADILLSFEMIEHLRDPIQFMHNLATKSSCKRMIITVPYLKKSRVGLRFIRKKLKQQNANAENTHIFELSPEDWQLIFQFSGWKTIYEKIYFQYPRKSIFVFMKPLWKKADFEGFWGAILEKDITWSKLYNDW